MRFSDTSPEVEARQLEIYRAMSAGQSLRLALEMSDSVREITKAGIRQQHPDWSQAKITRELLRLTLLPQELPYSLR